MLEKNGRVGRDSFFFFHFFYEELHHIYQIYSDFAHNSYKHLLSLFLNDSKSTDRTANMVDPDQLLLLEQFDLGLHCLLSPPCPNV